MKIIITCLSIILCYTQAIGQQSSPNILLIIADDLGIDAIEGFGINTETPNTPNLDNLRAKGLSFTNTWATPQCTPTRAAIMSGKHGINTGVMRPPGNLDLEHESIFNYIKNNSNSDYATAVIGKWHISNPVDYDHPAQHGIGHYEGFFTAEVNDYYNWEKIENGESILIEEYATTNLTNSAIDWIGEQDQPWFLWLAHVAPHKPWHVPPTGLYSIDNPTSNTQKYQAAIEAMDHEIGRLIDNIDQDQLDNTVIIFIGDNGTPNPVLQHYPDGHSKSSVYEGGLRVPMLIAGKGVSRMGEVENGLSQVTDLYSTIVELTSGPINGGVHNSLSLKPSMSCASAIKRQFLYSDYKNGNTLEWAIRNEQYKMIKDEDGNIQFFDISMDILEENNLYPNLTTAQSLILNALEAEADIIRTGWSCEDGIQNGNESTIDDCDNDCNDFDELNFENVGCCATPEVPSVFYEFVENDTRSIYSNGFPNHAYCFNSNNIPEQIYHLFVLDRTPTIADEITSVLGNTGRPARYFGVAMNGVIYAPAPATPFIFENPNTGQYNWDWVFEPTNNQGQGMGLVSLDCASAHTGPQGYHYHGEMFEYLETTNPGVTALANSEQVLQVGWASDGFPILYKFGPDAEGNIKELRPSYQLISGLRPGDGIEEPCGPYTGKYVNDYEYKCGKGDLDECNGIAQQITLTTSEGEETFDYFYVITSEFPQVSRCLVGTVSPDFENNVDPLTGVDDDGDGFLSIYDCDDNNPDINPNAIEIEGNDIDENCDGQITAVTDLSELGFAIGPNPNKGRFEITCNDDERFDVEIIDKQGRIIKRQSGIGSIIVDGLSPGLYTVVLSQNQQVIGSSKIVVSQ